MLKFQLILLMLLFWENSFSQVYDSVETNAREYFLALAGNKDNVQSEFQKLKSSLVIGTDSDDLHNNRGYDSLISTLNLYEGETKKISIDSASVLFHRWYLQLSNTFYDKSVDRFFNTKKDKLIFFSTSMSCYCTLEMCRKQAVEIMNFAREHNLSYWIIDSYEHNDLQIKYETLFAPSVILFDPENKLLARIEYDEQMLKTLNSFYSQRMQK